MKTVARVASEMLQDPNLSERSRRIYTDILRWFLNEHGYRDIREIDRDDIKGFLNRWDDSKHKTYNLSHSVINRLFNLALRLEYVEQNPVSKLSRRRASKAKGEVQRESVAYLSNAQVELLFRRARSNLRLLSLLHLLYDSGARIAEVLSVDIAAINFKRREFPVIGKGNKERVCYFRPETGELILRYIDRGRESGTDALFTERMKRSARVKRLTYHTAYMDLSEITQDNKELRGITFHQLRHTFATERANQIPIESLKALLGHASISTTQIYQKVTSEVAKDAAFEAFAKLPSPKL